MSMHFVNLFDRLLQLLSSHCLRQLQLLLNPRLFFDPHSAHPRIKQCHHRLMSRQIALNTRIKQRYHLLRHLLTE